MTNFQNDANAGWQRPRHANWPNYTCSAGDEAIDLAAMAGLELDATQQQVLRHAMGDRGGKWAAFEVAIVAPRQNGKDAILEARELAGLFILREPLQIHSAHQFDTSLEHFRRLRFLIENTPDLERRIKRISGSHGEEGIEVIGGPRIRFRTRTKGGGRGFTGDTIYLNEAMDLPEMAMSALIPTLSARPNPQIWYTASAVDQLVHDHGLALARIRERGINGDPQLAYFEWSVDAPNPDDVPEEIAGDEAQWLLSNWSFGKRISRDYIAAEKRSLDPRSFAVERLGVGDWPDTSGFGQSPIDSRKWAAAVDRRSQPQEPLWFSFDVMPDRAAASIGVCGPRADGRAHIEVAKRGRGTNWVVDWLVERVETHSAAGVVVDARGPAGSLVQELELRGVPVTLVNASEHAQACGLLVDAVEGDKIRHLGQPELDTAVRGAAKRTLSDAWAWSRRTSTIDISPLVACTLAFWASETCSVGGGLVFA